MLAQPNQPCELNTNAIVYVRLSQRPKNGELNSVETQMRACLNEIKKRNNHFKTSFSEITSAYTGTQTNLFNFLKHIFETNGLESEIVKLGMPQASATKRIKKYLALNPNATGKEAAEAVGVTLCNLRRIKSINGLTNRNTIDELMKIVDDKEVEIAKLKNIIRTLIS